MKIIRQKKDIVIYDDQDPRNDMMMTHGHGSIICDYQTIFDKLGTPNGKTDGYKVSAEWEVITPHGIVTIYDYKSSKRYCGREEGVHYKQNTDWHIGSHSQEAADFIKKVFFK